MHNLICICVGENPRYLDIEFILIRYRYMREDRRWTGYIFNTDNKFLSAFKKMSDEVIFLITSVADDDGFLRIVRSPDHIDQGVCLSGFCGSINTDILVDFIQNIVQSVEVKLIISFPVFGLMVCFWIVWVQGNIDIRAIAGKKTVSVQRPHIAGKQLIHLHENSPQGFRIQFLSLLAESRISRNRIWTHEITKLRFDTFILELNQDFQDFVRI